MGRRFLLSKSALLLVSVLSAAPSFQNNPQQDGVVVVAKRGKPGRISGTVLKYQLDLRTNLQSREPVSGAEVTLKGDGFQMKVRTKETGTFWISGMPAGTYTVTCTPPDLLGIDEGRAVRKVELPDGGRWSMNFTTYNKGGIRGRITPFPGLRLDLVLEQPAYQEFPRALHAGPDENGDYEFANIAPGRYRLGIRLDRSFNSLPFARYYYPGVTDPAGAVTIDLAEGQWLQLEDMALPSVLTARTVAGKVVYSDGRPAGNAEISFQLIEYPWHSPAGTARSDADGRFSSRLFDGLRYAIHAVGLGSVRAVPLSADTVEIPGSGDATNVTLVLANEIKAVNILQNPHGAHGIVPWQGRGEAVPELNLGIACFALRNGGHLSQEILLPRNSGGRFALVSGWLSSERINSDGAITELPYMEVTMWPYRGRPDDKYLEGRIRPLLQKPLETPGEWVWASGIGEIPPNAGRIGFLMNQAERLGVPHNGSASRFTGLGFYLFDTMQEAGLYRDYLMARRP